jgi:hypothetical protein
VYKRQVFDVASIGEDADPTPRDGTIAFDFDTDELPAGDLTLSARFVPGPGYDASESEDQQVQLSALGTHLLVSPSSTESTPGATVVIAGHIQLLGGGGDLQRVAPPEVEGTLVAFSGDDILGFSDIDPQTSSAELQLANIPTGNGTLRLLFVPDSPTLAMAEASIPFTVTDPNADTPGTPGTLPTTGVAVPTGVIAVAAALALLLGCVITAMRRRGARI